jgi:hypothetical protein
MRKYSKYLETVSPTSLVQEPGDVMPVRKSTAVGASRSVRVAPVRNSTLAGNRLMVTGASKVVRKSTVLAKAKPSGKAKAAPKVSVKTTVKTASGSKTKSKSKT